MESVEFIRDPILYPDLVEFKIVKSTSKYDKLVEIKKEVDYYYKLLVDRMRNPTDWMNSIKIDDTPCCESIQSILDELKDKFNPDFPTYTTFFKCFYYHSLTDFDNFYYDKNHIPTIVQQSEMFTGDLKVFFLEKVLDDINKKNQKFKYAERLLNFNANFKEIIDNEKPKRITKQIHESNVIIKEDKPSHRQIALRYRYLLMKGFFTGINENNMDDIANEYGWTAPYSGKKIYQRFLETHTTTARTAKGRNTIKDLEGAIKILEDYPEAQATARDELNTAIAKDEKK